MPPKIQQKGALLTCLTQQDYLLKIQYFVNFSLVSLSMHPRSRRGDPRIRKGEGRCSRPPKTSTRWGRPPKTFTCFIRSIPADIRQNKRSRECHRKIQSITIATNYRMGMMAISVYHPGAEEIKIQPKFPEFFLHMRYFGNFSLVSLGIGPRLRRRAERIRHSDGRSSRPLKTALERSYLTENSSSANRILRPRRKTTPDRIPERE